MHCCMSVSVCLLCLLAALSFPSLIDPMYWQQVKTINFFYEIKERKKSLAASLGPLLGKKNTHTRKKKEKNKKKKKKKGKKWQPNSSPIPP